MHKKRKKAIKMLISGTGGIDHVILLFDDGSSNLVTDKENNKQGSGLLKPLDMNLFEYFLVQIKYW